MPKDLSSLTHILHSYDLFCGHDVGQWVANLACEGRYDPKTSVSIGLLRGDRIVAGAIFNNWNEQSVQLHMAVERMNRTFLAMLAWYAFCQLNAQKVIAPVSSANIKSRGVLFHAGFTLEATLVNAHPLGDLLLYTMTPEQCRFLADPFLSRLESYYGR